MQRHLLGKCCAVLWLCQATLAQAAERTYVAAVYEHSVVLNPRPREPLGRRAALEHMRQNLDMLEKQAAAAARQGAQIIVFPEDAIHGFNYTRESISGYLETVPDPAAVSWSPCSEPDRFPDTEVLHRLSCMALKNALYLVANMPDRQDCDCRLDPRCPPDGRYQFNTDVVFSANGTIVARYHKQNLYFEAAFDVPPHCEHVTFDTPFAGKFGVFTCFDILFYEPAVSLVEKWGVRQLVYPTAWMNQLPLLAAVQFQRAFSFAAGVTLLAANVRAGGLGMTGSGIFTPWHTVYQHNTENEEGQLLLATIPILDTETSRTSQEWAREPFSGNSHLEPQFCGGTQVCEQDPFPITPTSANSSSTFHSVMMYDNFTLVPLEGSEGNLTACDGLLCCHLLFRRSAAPGELYALGAFRGLHIIHGTYALEVCALVRCPGPTFTSCGGEIDHANTRMDFRLWGNFTTRYVFPSVLGSGMQLERPDRHGPEGAGFFMSKAGMARGLVTACLYGRVYHKDREA
ncbi:biotinidase isoform X1 [Paramormyrops kingsleyae]|uniref:biotinidase isoform X1 n=1 Tax=Paramormyrops kingsleyae TaxID=1676925 RepID=UPI003B96FE5E